jgi:predicted O-linked N-acetylglucosamine transferase (SPINDLY family)
MAIAESTLTRADYGLLAHATVFCCFNGIYKIEPSVFRVWMRILKQVPDSVLWLADAGKPIIIERLRRQAENLGIEPNRLVFAANLPHADYLARYHLADLFLDTFTYNAGATAVGALWAGLPVLTCPGETYTSRMGAGVCAAAGMPELICSSPEHYQQRAVELGNHPEQLKALKARLAEAVKTAPLFNSQLFVRELEQAFSKMWQSFVVNNALY